MKVVKCQNGHFFDYDKYVVCPHCGSEIEDASNSNGDKKVPSKKGLFKKKKTGKDLSAGVSRTPEELLQTATQNISPISVMDTSPMPIFTPVTGENTVSPKLNTDSGMLPINDTNDDSGKKLVGVKTYDIWRGVAAEEIIHEKTPDEELAEVIAPIKPVVVEEDYEEAETEKPVNVVKQNSNPVNSLEKEIQKVSSTEEGRTIGFFSQIAHMPVTTSNTTTDTHLEVSVEPIVGWLVCCGGTLLGRSYNIVAGRNSIGRADNNQIVIKDNQVSREKHAWISYEPKKREFYLQPGESSGLTYLNGENIMIPQKLTRYDKVEMGGSMFIFVPLCDEVFSWEDYIK